MSRVLTADQISTHDSHGRAAKKAVEEGRCWTCGRTGQQVKITETKIEEEAPGYWVSCLNGCPPK